MKEQMQWKIADYFDNEDKAIKLSASLRRIGIKTATRYIPEDEEGGEFWEVLALLPIDKGERSD